MIKRQLSIGLLLLAGLLCAAQQTVIKKVPITNVSAASGEKMYQTYCAACHGTDGKGAGPAAPALKTPPPDLTTLAKRHDGKFQSANVYNTLLGDTAMPAAHGSKDMPVWGGLFTSLCKGRSTDVEVTQRASNLTSYVESLQHE